MLRTVCCRLITAPMPPSDTARSVPFKTRKLLGDIMPIMSLQVKFPDTCSFPDNTNTSRLTTLPDRSTGGQEDEEEAREMKNMIATRNHHTVNETMHSENKCGLIENASLERTK